MAAPTGAAPRCPLITNLRQNKKSPRLRRIARRERHINHLDAALGSVSDPFIRSRYVGFVALSAATVFELAIKEIFCTFAAQKHKVLGNFTSVYFDRLNGQIGRDRIERTYLKFFGDKYVQRFAVKLEKAERQRLRSSSQCSTSMACQASIVT